jgi:hypothetical protein
MPWEGNDHSLELNRYELERVIDSMTSTGRTPPETLGRHDLRGPASARPRGYLPLLAARRFFPWTATCRYLPRAARRSRQVAATCGYLPRGSHKNLSHGK